jgi:N-acetylglucosamine-6-sulfatase
VPEQAPIVSIRRRQRTLAAFAGVLLALGILALVGGRATEPQAAEAAAGQAKPNIIVLFTDDQEPSSLRVMKKVTKELKRKGVTMRRFYTQFPLCCPSRATMLTGQYAHNHGVLSNTAPTGGYGTFNDLHGDNYLPLWMQGAGYRTAFVGKYMNEYAEPDEYGTTPRDVPRGWDDWRVLAPSRAQYFNYQLNQNGNIRQFSEREEHYSTDVFTMKAKKFIRRSAPGKTPYFLTLGYAAPHGGGGGQPGRSCNRAAVPAPRHLGALKGRQRKLLRMPSPAFNEADISDKPSPLANNEPLTEGQAADLLRKRRCAWESLLAVDESIDTLISEVKRSGERRNTYIFFTSDNGYLRGEHRIRNQKRYLYEESARVPFVARGPGIARNKRSDDVVTNADLVPTILELSGAQPGETQDGQSLMPSLAEPDLERGRAIQMEAFAIGPQITGLRTSRYLYAEWDTGKALPERELYDTDADPYQLDNLANDPAYLPVVLDMRQQLQQMRDCVGEGCRGAPTGQLSFATGGNGKRGCSIEPVIAQFSGSNAGDIVSVQFRIEKKLVGTVTSSPYELGLPYRELRKRAPKAVTVLATALYEDGRRLTAPAKLRGCQSS